MKIYENLLLENLDGEIWKDIEGYNGDYQVSNFGRVKSFKRYKGGQILKQDKNNYLQIKLWNDKIKKGKQIHTILYETFNNYKLKNDECIHHIDGNRVNNNINNLGLMSKSYHAYYHNNGKKYSERTKQLIREKKLGIKRSEESNKKLSISRKEKFRNGELNNNGENNPMHKLEEWQVKSIYQISNSSIIKKLKITQKEIGEVFGIGERAVSKIKLKLRWKSIL